MKTLLNAKLIIASPKLTISGQSGANFPKC